MAILVTQYYTILYCWIYLNVDLNLVYLIWHNYPVTRQWDQADLVVLLISYLVSPSLNCKDLPSSRYPPSKCFNLQSGHIDHIKSWNISDFDKLSENYAKCQFRPMIVVVLVRETIFPCLLRKNRKKRKKQPNIMISAKRPRQMVKTTFN